MEVAGLDSARIEFILNLYHTLVDYDELDKDETLTFTIRDGSQVSCRGCLAHRLKVKMASVPVFYQPAVMAGDDEGSSPVP